MVLSDLFKTSLCLQGAFQTSAKTFRTLDPIQPLASMLRSVEGSFSFYKIPFDSLGVIRHHKNIFRSPHRLFIPPIYFGLPKAQSEP